MSKADVMNEAVRRIPLEEIGICRLYVTVTLAGDEAAAWLTRLNAWEALLRLNAATSYH